MSDELSSYAVSLSARRIAKQSSPRDEPAFSNRDIVVSVPGSPVRALEQLQIV